MEQSTEAEMETIRRCLSELQSHDQAVRHRAVLLIGKYRHPLAAQAVITAMVDPASQVRLAALVAVSENQAANPEAVAAVFRLLADENVHVRRMASSMLNEVPMFPHVWPGTPDLPPPLRQSAADVMPQHLEVPAVDKKLFADNVNRALADEDETVVRNMLAVANRFSKIIDRGQLEKLLLHPELRVRGLALRACLSVLHGQELIDSLTVMAKDSEVSIRENLAASLSRAGAAAQPLLREMIKDPAPTVRLRAAINLARMRDRQSLAEIAAVFTDKELTAGERRELIPYLIHLEQEGRDLVLQAALQGEDSLRPEALRALATNPGIDLPLTFFLDLLDDPLSDVRKSAVSGIMVRRDQINPEQVKKLYHSKFPEVRQASLIFIGQIPAAERPEVILDLLIDDDLQVRKSALGLVCRMAVPGWPDIMRMTLKDRNPEVREAAVDALLSVPFPEARQILLDFLPTVEDAELQARIRQQLDARAVQRQRPGIQTRPQPARAQPRLQPGVPAVRPGPIRVPLRQQQQQRPPVRRPVPVTPPPAEP